MALDNLMAIVEAQTRMARVQLELDGAKDEARYRKTLINGMVEDEEFNRLNKRFERLVAAKKAMEEAGLPWTQQSALEEAAKAVAEAADPAVKDSTTT